jgi:hypothetical protein
VRVPICPLRLVALTVTELTPEEVVVMVKPSVTLQVALRLGLLNSYSPVAQRVDIPVIAAGGGVTNPCSKKREYI